MEALRGIGTENATQRADALTENLSSGKVKGFFRDLLKKVAPGLPEIPGITEDGPIEPETGETSEDEQEGTDIFKSAPDSGDAVTE